MKILLATLSIEPASRFEHNPNTAYPIGLAYIYSVLEKEGHEVKLLFLNNYDEDFSEKKLFECFEMFKPEIIGFQIFSMNRVSTFNAIEKLKICSPHTRIIVGGDTHISNV
ncbi:MAG: B12 binding domain protein [Candidatus Argoarchaeum ethanivorans]|uniref:B12 binding domain protein n=1 Tax=Candidatus Argoarchaeum ethanivorans TaxID=2608793 RepID=A0A811T3U6_9EURY|nr:MAG: B12 binding domain protein [Candidatus Argoarchaeum ethanivorans]